MPSFDTVSEVDLQEVMNAIDQTAREVGNRFDFKGSSAGVSGKENQITVKADNEFQLGQVKDILNLKLAKRGIDILSLKAGKVEAGNNQVRQTIEVQQGINQDTSRKIVKLIKEKKLKVQASIQGEKVRVTGKKRDDLQNVIGLLNDSKLDVPLQFINFRD
ncbi:MAG: YajQ family cyclic di-GMP-binding protein [Gammaproteobacteria bacterium]